jgi:hypothetical protein
MSSDAPEPPRDAITDDLRSLKQELAEALRIVRHVRDAAAAGFLGASHVRALRRAMDTLHSAQASLERHLANSPSSPDEP